MSVDEYENNADLGYFQCDNVQLLNDFNEQFMSWSGWAISTMTDVTTAGFTNQYSSYTGSGHNSMTYAVTYAFSGSIIRLDERSTVESISVSNSTYAYLSMLNGDAIAKKFGGETGNDPDFFRLKVQKYLDGQLGAEEVVFELADYSFSDNSQDYIFEGWHELDLNGLGLCDSLLFTLSSSDNGDFGMNTPAYFCIDNILTMPDPIGLDEVLDISLNVYPNPVSTQLFVEVDSDVWMECFNTQGQIVYSDWLRSGQNQVDVSEWAKGMYIYRMRRDEASIQGKLMVD